MYYNIVLKTSKNIREVLWVEFITWTWKMHQMRNMRYNLVLSLHDSWRKDGRTLLHDDLSKGSRKGVGVDSSAGALDLAYKIR